MSDELPPCPECSGTYVYPSGETFACPECGHEWVPGETAANDDADPVIRDSVGNVLNDGDDVIVVKDLKVKGASGPIKVGTKVRGIRLIDGVGDHDIDCKVDGFGAMQLKSSVVRKA